jgi:hypothetical protein
LTVFRRFYPVPVFTAVFTSLSALFRSRAALQLEILALRHQLCVLQRSVERPKLTPADRFFWARLSQFWMAWRSALVIIKPETVIGWHRKSFRLLWTWKVRRGQRGRPPMSKEVRKLIRRMSRENPLWGAPRIYGELLKLGIDIGETSVSKYMVRRRSPPSQTWRTFLENLGLMAELSARRIRPTPAPDDSALGNCMERRPSGKSVSTLAVAYVLARTIRARSRGEIRAVRREGRVDACAAGLRALGRNPLRRPRPARMHVPGGNSSRSSPGYPGASAVGIEDGFRSSTPAPLLHSGPGQGASP